MIPYSMQYPRLQLKREQKVILIEALKFRIPDAGLIRKIRLIGLKWQGIIKIFQFTMFFSAQPMTGEEDT